MGGAMELNITEMIEGLQGSLERLGARLEAAAGLLEGSAARMLETGEVGKITASVESSSREAELERQLAEAREELASMRASSAASAGRKTMPATTVQLLAKSGLDAGESVDVQSVDAALAGLSVEERIAVKSQMLRAGTLTR